MSTFNEGVEESKSFDTADASTGPIPPPPPPVTDTADASTGPIPPPPPPVTDTADASTEEEATNNRFSEAWGAYTNELIYGLTDAHHDNYLVTCTIITIMTILLICYTIAGVPFLDREKVKYKNNKGHICRNGIRVIFGSSISYSVDTCYRPIKVSDYIKDDNQASKFEEKYIKERRNGRSAYSACMNALRRIDQRLDMEYNYVMEKRNSDDMISESYKIFACKLYNDFFAEENTKRNCVEKVLVIGRKRWK